MYDETLKTEDAIGMEFEVAMGSCLLAILFSLIGALPCLTAIAVLGWIASALRRAA